MKLPVIKHINQFVAENDIDYVHESIELLEHMAEAPNIKDAELDVLAELLSNLYGAIEVHQLTKKGIPEKEALNSFMQRVIGSIAT